MRRVLLAIAVLLLAFAPLALPQDTHAAPSVISLTATDDATIRPDARSSINYGSAPNLLVDQSSEKDFLLKFVVAGVGSQTVTKATLRLHAFDPSPVGGDFSLVADNSWSESTVTWDTAPAGDGGVVGSLDAVAANTWVEVDVTATVTGDGPISFRASSTHPDGADYFSKEHPANLAPQLVVELDGAPPSDKEPPSAPPSLTVSAPLSTQVALSWDPSTDNVGVNGYDVFRDSKLLASLPAASNSYQDQDVQPRTTYTYEVVATDAAGNTSAPSTAEVTTPADSPGGVRLTAAGDHGGLNSLGGQTLGLIAAINPDAHLALGDLSYSERSPETAWCDWVRNGDPAAGVTGVGTIPFQLVAGNHEEDSRLDGFIRDFADCLPDRAGAVGDYGVEYYMDFAATVRVIMIAPNLTIDGQRYDYNSGPRRAWLEQTVTDARSAGIPWVVVGMHKLCVSVSTKSCEIDDPMLDWLLAPGRADVVMHGHSHSVQRSHQLSCVDENTTTQACIVDTDGSHAQGAGGVILIGGTFGRSADPVDTSDPELGYFASWMDGDNAPSNQEQGLWLLDFTKSDLTGQWVGSTSSYSDSFTIGTGAPPSNRAPVAADDSGAGFTTTQNTAFTTADVLANDTDPDNDRLNVTDLDTTGTQGTVTNNNDGTFDYTPANGTTGTDTFGYTVSDPDGATDTATVTITIEAGPPGPEVLTFNPTDDATIRPGTRSTRNYGSAPEIQVDLSLEKDFLLKFDVTGVGNRTISNATLRLRATDPSATGGDFHLVTDDNWSESTVTWDGAPAGDGGLVGSLGRVVPGSWYELDVTPVVSGDGHVSLRASSGNVDGADYASKENPANLSPELVVELN